MTEVRTESGILRGLVDDGIHLFRGVPYAAPPFGARRFAPPQPSEPWHGVRDATRRGVAAPQPSPPATDPWAPMYAPDATGEDCLTLEITTPDVGTVGMPVVVHIHGGGYVTGAGSMPVYAGRGFAHRGLVHVSINYRLGLEGFLYLGEGRDNLGMRDQIAALEWVQRNIAAFGGDPAQVTIMGQSAGGVSIFTHLAMPRSAPLHRRAIAQSGSTIVSIDPDTAARQARRVARMLRVPATVHGFRTVPVERMTATAQKVATRFLVGILRGDEQSLMLTPFRNVHGTDLLPAPPSESHSAVPLLAGTVVNETIGFVEALAGMPLLRGIARRGLRRAIGHDRIAELRDGPRRLTGVDAQLEAGWTDWGFRMPTLRAVQQRPGPSWLYEFRWHAADRPQGAVHGIELPFAADTMETVSSLGAEARTYFAGAPASLVTELHGAFIDFIRTGDPGWAPYGDDTREPKVFDA